VFSIKIDLLGIYLNINPKLTMNNKEYLRYALQGRKEVIHKLQDDIQKLEMEKQQLREDKKDIITKNHKLVEMATYYKERSEEQEKIHKDIVASFEKEIAIYEKSRKRWNDRMNKSPREEVIPKKLTLVEKIQRNAERNRRRKMEGVLPKI
jgi:hypothetical protein